MMLLDDAKACGEEIDGLVYLDAIRRGSLYVHNGASAFYLRGKTAGGKDVELACLGDGVDIVPRRYMDSRRLSISHFGDEDELAAAYNFILD